MDNEVSAIKYANVVNFVAGIWLLFAPFVFEGTTASAWNDVLVGLVLIPLATWQLLKPEIHGTDWTNASLGAWLLIAPTTFHYHVLAHFWSDVTVGLILGVSAAWVALIHGTRKPSDTSDAD